MKVKVHRQLANGVYQVAFDISDFTPEELKKMSSFGVPKVSVQYFGNSGMNIRRDLPLNKVTRDWVANFDDEKAARSYEAEVLAQVKNTVTSLRLKRDLFSSSDEVEF